MSIRLVATFITIALLTPPSNAAGLDGVCPSSLAETLTVIDKHLHSENWVNIDIRSCGNIQSEIADAAKQLIESEKTMELLPLMSAGTMRIYRNTFYALQGYDFKSEDLSEHFNKFSWYRPQISDPSHVDLNKSNTKIVSLLKDIETNWTNFCDNCYTNVRFSESALPKNVNIKKDEIIFQNKGIVDISPRAESTSDPDRNNHISYRVYGLQPWDSLLVCEYVDAREFGVDLIAISKLSLYSTNGVLLNEINTRSSEHSDIFSNDCPKIPTSHTDTAISLSDMGCCRGTHGTLYVFNRSLKLMSQSSQDGAPIHLFETLSKKELYYLTIEGTYERSKDRAMSGNTHRLLRISEDGSDELLSKTTTELLYKDGAFSSYGTYQHINLYEQPKNFNGGNIAVAIKTNDNIVLFWFNHYHGEPDGTTIIPI